MKKKKTRIFIDGACEPNPGSGGWGVIIRTGSNKKAKYYGGEADTTNARMEVMAMYKGLKKVTDRDQRIEVYSDSAYVVNTIREGWYKKWNLDDPDCSYKHADLWRKIVKLLNKFEDIEVFHIKAHLDLTDRDELEEWRQKFNEKHDQNINMGTFKVLVKMNNEVDKLAGKRISRL